MQNPLIDPPRSLIWGRFLQTNMYVCRLFVFAGAMTTENAVDGGMEVRFHTAAAMVMEAPCPDLGCRTSIFTDGNLVGEAEL